MAAIPQQQAPIQTSRYAQKYGLLPDQGPFSEYFIQRGKSGRTPTSPPSIRFRTEQEIQEKSYVEDSQREFLGGFSARELLEMNIYPSDLATPSTLSNPLLPFLQRTHWTDERVLPQGADFRLMTDPQIDPRFRFNNDRSSPYSGRWTAHNPVVWEALLPILRLVSRVFTQMHTLPWVDAFLFGTWEQLINPIDGKRWPGMYKFRQRQELLRYTTNEVFRKRDFFAACFDTLSLGIDSTDNPTWPGLAPGGRQSGMTWSGITYIPPDFGPQNAYVRVFIACELLTPLFRSDLNASELLREQLRVANIFIHEMGHVLGIMAPTRRGYTGQHQPPLLPISASIPAHGLPSHPDSLGSISDSLGDVTCSPEPYYENEVRSELGNSLTNALFGGLMKAYTPHLRLPAIALATICWPSHGWTANSDQSIQIRPLPPTYDIVHIMSDYYQYIASENFWNATIMQHGLQMLKPHRPANIINVHPGETPVAIVLDTRYDGVPDWGPAHRHAKGLLVDQLSMNPQQRVAHEAAQRIKQQASETARHRVQRQSHYHRSESIKRQQQKLISAWDHEDIQEIVKRQKELFKLYKAEGDYQLNESIRLTTRAPSLQADAVTEYRDWLLVLNRSIRSIITQFAFEVDKVSNITLSDEIKALLTTCANAFYHLQAKPLGTYANPAAAKVYFTLPVMTAHDANQANDLEARNQSVLKAAEAARNSGDEALCQRLCHDMIWDEGCGQLLRALSCLALSRSSMEHRRVFYAKLGVTLLENLRTTCTEVERARLEHKIADGMILVQQAKQAESDMITAGRGQVFMCSDC